MEKTQVVVVPFPAQGHLNQLLHLSRSLAERRISVLFVTTSSHIHQARHRVQGWDLGRFDIRFEELPMPDFFYLDPDIESMHKFPTHLMPLFEACETLQQPFERLIRNISAMDGESILPQRRIVIIHDSLMGWVQTVAVKYKIPAYIFSCVSAHFTSLFSRAVGKGLYELRDLKLQYPESFLQFISRQEPLGPLAKGEIFNTFPALEAKYINDLREIKGTVKPIWTVGPLLPQVPLYESSETLKTASADFDCLRWLDGQAPASVLYVSFGSLSSLCTPQIRQLALGLEASQQPFLWVIRAPDSAIFSTDLQMDWISKMLPEGYEGRLGGRCFVARNWAPQLHILSHKSTGGFLSHCGWNSCLESISLGVPMVAWPLHSDQYSNSLLMARELKVGIEVKEWPNDQEEDDLVKADEVERAVRRLMVDMEGKEVRQRSLRLKAEAQREIAAGGSSWKELESFINHFSTTLDTIESGNEAHD
eukprot:Gb_07987 [translate_table: standard]